MKLRSRLCVCGGALRNSEIQMSQIYEWKKFQDYKVTNLQEKTEILRLKKIMEVNFKF